MLLTRDHLVKLGCGLAGGALSLALAHFMAPSVALVLPKPPTPVRVSVKAASVAPAAAVAPPSIQDKELRLKSKKPVEELKPKPRRKPPAPEPTPKAVTEPPAQLAENEPGAASGLPTLAQPALPLVPATAIPALPTMAGAPEAPEAPPEDATVPPQAKVYPEEPGGNILVLGLLVNDQGIVVDSNILVSSFKPLSDIAVAWASIGQKWTNLQPPLNPGEKRWIELRIPFEREADRLKTLP